MWLWSPRLLDLNPCNLYLWDMLNDEVYSNNTCSEGDLERGIHSADPTISPAEPSLFFKNGKSLWSDQWYGPDKLWTYVEIKCQLDATEVFIADLTACSTCFGHPHQTSYLKNHSTKYHRQQPLYNTLELLMMGIVMPEHVEQAVRSAIKTSVASSWHFISTY